MWLTVFRAVANRFKSESGGVYVHNDLCAVGKFSKPAPHINTAYTYAALGKSTGAAARDQSETGWHHMANMNRISNYAKHGNTRLSQNHHQLTIVFLLIARRILRFLLCG